MGDRDNRTARAGQCFNLSIKLMCKRLDDTGAESDFLLSEDTVMSANPVVGDRKLPVCSGYIVPNADFTDDFLVGKRMLEHIHNEFGDDQANALGLTGRNNTRFAFHSQCDWATVANH